MKRIQTISIAIVLLLGVLTINSCLTLISDEELISIYTPIEVGITYSEETDDLYRFTPPISGRYIISIIGTDSDLSWMLSDDPNPEAGNPLVYQVNDGIIDEGTRTPPLSAGKEYYLVVIEDKKTYELSILPE